MGLMTINISYLSLQNMEGRLKYGKNFLQVRVLKCLHDRRSVIAVLRHKYWFSRISDCSIELWRQVTGGSQGLAAGSVTWSIVACNQVLQQTATGRKALQLLADISGQQFTKLLHLNIRRCSNCPWHGRWLRGYPGTCASTERLQGAMNAAWNSLTLVQFNF
jgi:hypothetical protein